MYKKNIVLASALLALAMVLSMMALPALCGTAAPAALPAADEVEAYEPMEELQTDTTTFVMLSIGEPDYLDPAVDCEAAGGEVIQNVYETLVWYDGDSAACLTPLLATEVPTVDNGGMSADGMNYTFHIREGVTFHDGTALTAEDVAYSIQRVLRIHDPSGPSWMLEQLMTNLLSFYIDGSTTVGEWAAYEAVPDWLLEGAGLTDPGAVLSEAHSQAVAEFMVTEVDGMTVNFRLTKSYPAFVKICAATVMSIVSKDYVEGNGGIVDGEHNSVMDETVCGTGPYTMLAGDWEHGTRIHLTRNSDYWGATPSLDDVYIVVVSDVNTRISMLENGTADSISVGIEYEDWFMGNSNYTVVKGLPSYDVESAGFNMDIDTVDAGVYGGDVPADFFTDVNVRHAFVRMLDSDAFIEDVLMGNAIEPNGPIPMGMFGYDASVPTYEYDLEAAKTYLQAAVNEDTGNSWWEDGFNIALFYNVGNAYRQAFCEYLNTALDDLTAMAAGDTDAVFNAYVNVLDWYTYLSMRGSTPSPFPMFYLGWSPDYADPDDYVTLFLHSVYGWGPYYTGYQNSTLDDLIADAAAEVDEEARAGMYSDISWSAYDDAPYIWLWQGNSFHVERSWVNGYYFNPMYSSLYYAALSKEATPEVIEAVIYSDPPVGIVGSPVTFDGFSSYSNAGEIVSYEWDFDDAGGASSGAMVEHEFSAAGTYNVSLTVTDDLDNTDTAVIQYVVEEAPVNEPPTAVADADPTSALVGEEVALNGSGSSDPDGAIVSYEWVITQGLAEIATLSGVTPVYTFTAAGSFKATLNVTDDGGLWDTDFVTITVTEPANEPPVADAGDDQSVEVGETATFDGSGSTDDVLVTNYTWNFTYDGGDVELWSEAPTFVFDIAGTYVVTLTVSDADDETDEDTVTITVSEPAPPGNVAPVADAGDDQTADVGETVTFDGSGSSDDVEVTNYTWTFTYDGVDVEMYGESPTYVFNIEGTYTVTLTVSDADGETDTDTVVITVEEPEEEPPPVEESFLEKYGLAIAVIVIVVIAALVAFMLLKRKKPT